MSKKVFWCKNCLNMSTRPRIEFDNKCWCNACQWSEEKKTFDWEGRKKELKKLLDKYRSNSGNFDCVVPVSGGKDGSYVAYTLKHKYGMNPLCITVAPALSLDLGDQNLKNFINSGYNHLHINPDVNIMQKLNKIGFVEKGFPYYGWLIAIQSAVIRTALNFNIPLLFYGEDGEVEYGGSTETKGNSLLSIDYQKKVWFEGGYDLVMSKVGNMKSSDLYFWNFPGDKEIGDKELHTATWSYFEPWDSYRNYVVAKEHCGLQEKEDSGSGTFTNFSQNDQALYSLHTYLMYLKFGFGRATQDAGIEIRRGSMTRDQAINLVQMYDNAYPHELIDTFLDYYGMTKNEFDSVLDNYVNKELFEKIEGIWQPKFEVGKSFSI
ncbi:MAG: N-acetyl sugar amidotransferase [Candidatus Marinimicrobia bacterium]|nr:N-acetyl sugar amidotransferase [Candidatus Neomarinimicrobiota bacterium]